MLTKTARGWVNIQITSWPDVMKKTSYPKKKRIVFLINKTFCIWKTMQHTEKRWDVLGSTYNMTTGQKRKSDTAFRVKSKHTRNFYQNNNAIQFKFVSKTSYSHSNKTCRACRYNFKETENSQGDCPGRHWGKLHRLQWRPGQSSCRHFRFNDTTKKPGTFPCSQVTAGHLGIRDP